MPELPEVEVVRRNLVGWAQGRIVTNIASSGRHRGVADDSLTAVFGCRIEAVDRQGKYLILQMGGQVLVIHLGMSGRLFSFDRGTYAVGPHDHVRISLDDERLLVFQDHRRFGRVFLSPLDLSALPCLGPDPTRVDLTPERLAGILSGRRSKLKPTLMDQTVISGLGNIYACEILWAARLSPHRNVSALDASDYLTLAASITDVLKRAIAAGGATLEDYRGTSGEMGNFDASFSVFGRAGERCPRCQSQIQGERLAARSTYWCPTCQR